jgi:hypothetical protein
MSGGLVDATRKESENSAIDRRLKIFDRALASCSTLVLVLTAFGGVLTYWHTRTRELDQQQAAIEQEMRKEKQDAYIALCEAACSIATCDTEAEVRTKAKDFLKLYIGKVHLVQDLDDDVVDKKIEFARKLISYVKLDDKSPYNTFSGPALGLVDACKDCLDPRAKKSSLSHQLADK